MEGMVEKELWNRRYFFYFSENWQYWSKDKKLQLQAIEIVKTNSRFNVFELHNGYKTYFLGHLRTQ